MRKSLKRKIYKDTFRFIWLPVCISVFSMCLENLLLVRSSGIFGNFADAVFALDMSAGLKQLGVFAAVLALTVLAVPAVDFVCDVILVNLAMAHDRTVLSRFLDKRCDAVGKVDAGDMLNRLNDDPNELRLTLLSVCASLITIPATAAYLIANVPKSRMIYFLIVFAVSLVKFVVPIFVKKSEKRYHRETKEYYSAVRSAETDFSDRAHLINLFGLSRKMIARQDTLYNKFFSATKRKSIRLDTAANTVLAFTDTVCALSVLFIGAYLVSLNRLSPGAVAAMLGYYSVLNKIIGECGELIRKLPVTDNLAERLVYFYEDAEPDTGKRINGIKALRGVNLTYSYSDKQVLGPLSFTVHNGEKVSVCGKNGSGKSTLLKVLLGLLGGYGGSLYVDGTELSDIRPDTYRGLLSYASQDPYLFKGTVLENIMLANPDADADEVKRLMSEYGILSLADREVGKNGYELSGGERQKLSIIRAMIKDTHVVFIDEPENNLDAASLEKFTKWIRGSNKTMIYVSHCPDLISCADRQISL